MEGKFVDRMEGMLILCERRRSIQFHGPQWNCLRDYVTMFVFCTFCALAIPLTKHQQSQMGANPSRYWGLETSKVNLRL